MNNWFCLSVFLLVNFAFAEIPKNEFAKCSMIDGDLEKLNCFDELARKYDLDGIQSSKKEIQDSGKWKINENINPIDDSKTVTVYLLSDSGRSSMMRRQIQLVLRCKSGSTELYINWYDYLGSDAKVLTRVGKNYATSSNWSLSTDSQATFYPGGRSKTIDFIKSLINEDSFVAQVTPYNESPVTAIFDIKGLQKAIQPLREACSW